MKRALLAFGLFLLAGALGSAPIAFAQRGQGMGPRMYDTSTVETLSGTVTAVDTIASQRGRRQHRGIHVRMTTADGEALTVHLGPLFYLQKQNVALQTNEAVTVRGSRVTLRKTPALIAAEVQTQGQTWTLRDSQGVPLWRQGRRGP